MRAATVPRLVLLGIAGLLLFGFSVACGGGLTFQQQRDAAVGFLRQMNQASNNLEDAFTAANVADKLASPPAASVPRQWRPFTAAKLGDKLTGGTVHQINAALTTLTQQMDGYQKLIAELTPPPEVADLAALTAAEQKSVVKFQEVLQQLRSGIQAGSEAKIAQAVQRLAFLDLDPDFKKPAELQQAILARFNIPDAEVSYRRPS